MHPLRGDGDRVSSESLERPAGASAFDSSSRCYKQAYSRWVDGEFLGCAEIVCRREMWGAKLWTAHIWWGGKWHSVIRLRLNREEHPIRYQHTLLRDDLQRTLRGKMDGDQLSVEDAGLVTTQKKEYAAWGPSSGLDPGHPLLWGSWLSVETRASVRVVRIDPFQFRGWTVDLFHITMAGRDHLGRRLRVDTAWGRVALWVDEKGRLVRLRRRTSGPGSPVEDWRRAEGCLFDDGDPPLVDDGDPPLVSGRKPGAKEF